ALNKNERITWKGQFRPALEDQQVLPRAAQEEIPVWIAVGGTPKSVVRAARLGLPLMIAIIGGSPRQFQPLVDLYREEYQFAGHDPKNMRIGIHSHAFFGENESLLSDQYFPIYADQMNRIGRTRGWAPYMRSQFEAGKTKEGALFVGEPERMVDKILYVQELFGLDRFAAHMDVGAPSHRDMMKSIEIYGTKIVPKVREALGVKKS